MLLIEEKIFCHKRSGPGTSGDPAEAAVLSSIAGGRGTTRIRLTSRACGHLDEVERQAGDGRAPGRSR